MPDTTDDERRALGEALAAALQADNVKLCPVRCDACQAGHHPGGAHPWWSESDAAHAAATGQAPPAGNCGCRCADQLPGSCDCDYCRDYCTADGPGLTAEQEEAQQITWDLLDAHMTDPPPPDLPARVGAGLARVIEMGGTPMLHGVAAAWAHAVREALETHKALQPGEKWVLVWDTVPEDPALLAAGRYLTAYVNDDRFGAARVLAAEERHPDPQRFRGTVLHVLLLTAQILRDILTDLGETVSETVTPETAAAKLLEALRATNPVDTAAAVSRILCDLEDAGGRGHLRAAIEALGATGAQILQGLHAAFCSCGCGGRGKLGVAALGSGGPRPDLEFATLYVTARANRAGDKARALLDAEIGHADPLRLSHALMATVYVVAHLQETARKAGRDMARAAAAPWN